MDVVLSELLFKDTNCCQVSQAKQTVSVCTAVGQTNAQSVDVGSPPTPVYEVLNYLADIALYITSISLPFFTQAFS